MQEQRQVEIRKDDGYPAGMLYLALLSVAIWLGLLLFRGGFWRADQRLSGGARDCGEWPEVVAVIPARDEAETIGAVLTSHAASAYPGKFSIILVDDGSQDGTGAIARGVTSTHPIHVIDAPEIEPGWTGKLWALHSGTAQIDHLAPEAAYVLLTDADIRHAPGTLTALVAKAEAQGLGLTSLMARLDARGLWGKLLIPAFIFFFQKLYPFPLVNDPSNPMAGAAGGCVLLKREALAKIGGVAAIRGALIDDCTLAAQVKAAGYPIWLGLADREVVSLRDNRSLSSVWKMVARTAFTQLGYSNLVLAGSTLGMALVYLAGPVALFLGIQGGEIGTALAGLATWALMVCAYRPTAKLYGLTWGQTSALPIAAVLYMAMTLDSARRHWAGKGGAWKGRVYPAAEN
ncbi:glycosyltransferase [Rhodobacteraceae bacterium NNCM2]|nr:glycosyltransferase [Coraliihabitans acroporae]